MSWDLEFITKEDFKKHVKFYFNKIHSLIQPSSVEEFNKNIIDPIKLTFTYFLTGQDISELVSAEQRRQIDKSMNNDIGYFHQNIFKYINGWHVPAEGFDIVKDDYSVYVELKNKHNTMNSSSSQKTYINMQNKIIESLEKNEEVTCMLVEVIAKKSQNISWEVTIDKEKKSSKHIRRVSIDKFYEFATGDKNAFQKLVSWLPITLKEIAIEEHKDAEEQEIIKELTKEKSFFLNLYNLAFENYEGFNSFKFVEDEKLGQDFKEKTEGKIVY